jgi:DNA topoisomerase IA
VQSVAVKLIVEREKQIKDFKPTSKWEIFRNLPLDDKKTDLKVVLKKPTPITDVEDFFKKL